SRMRHSAPLKTCRTITMQCAAQPSPATIALVPMWKATRRWTRWTGIARRPRRRRGNGKTRVTVAPAGADTVVAAAGATAAEITAEIGAGIRVDSMADGSHTAADR